MATLQDIADKAGVSTETVSRVLRGKYRQVGPRGVKRVEQVTQIAKDLGYRVNAAARSMKNQQSLMVGVVMPVDPNSQVAHAVSMEITFGLNSVLTDLGYVMSLLPVSYHEIASGQPVSRGLTEQVVDAYVVMDGIGHRLESHIQSAGKPVVWANAECPESGVSILRDEYRAGELAVEALARAGHTRVTNLERRAQGGSFSFAQRRAGVLAAADRLGLQCTNHQVDLHDDISKLPCVLEGEILESIDETGAVVLGDTYLARRVIGDLSRVRRHVVDYSLACCDDADEMGEVMPWLARASFNRFEMGRQAAFALMKLINGKVAKPYLMTPEWKDGQSIKS